MTTFDKRPRRAVALLCFAAFALTAALPLSATAADLDWLPAKTTAEAEEKYAAILDKAPGSITDLTKLLVVPGEQDDSKVRFVMRGLAIYVGSPNGAARREAYSKALIAQLGGKYDPAVKGYIIRQMHLVGGTGTVKALSALLTDKDLCEYAAQALLALKDDTTAGAFREALSRSRGECRLTIIQALGVLRAAKGIPAIAKALGDNNREVRLAAAYALANSGDPAAVEPLLKGADVDPLYERARMTDCALLLARRLGESGDKKQAERICRHFLKTRTADADVHVYCAAITSLAESMGAAVMDDVLAAMSSENADVRGAGIEAAIAMPGEEATQRWVARLKAAKPAGQIGILDLLARRADPAALPAVLEITKNPQEQVRLAAIKTIGSMGDERAVAPLAASLESATTVERGAIRNALLHLTGKPVTLAVARQIASAPPKTKADLIDILTARGGTEFLDTIIPYTTDKEAVVSSAAITSLGMLAQPKHLPALIKLLVEAPGRQVADAARKALEAACKRMNDKNGAVDAIAGTLKGVKGTPRAALLKVLGDIGNKKAYEVVRADLNDADAEVKDAAIRALASWRDDSPTAELLAIAKDTKQKATHRVLALRGYVNMIRISGNRTTAASLKMCRDAFAAAPRKEDKRMVLSALGGVVSPEALELAEAHLGDAALKTEAAVAVINIARGLSGGSPGRARAAIEKAAKAADNKEITRQAQEAMNHIERFDGFITVWKLSGPYTGGSLFKKKFPPEDPDAKDVKWKSVNLGGNANQPGVVDLNKLLQRGNNRTGYMRAQIWSPKEQPAQMQTGSDDGIRVWVNGELVFEKDAPRSLKVGEDKFAIKLRKGWNMLLVKVIQGGGDWSGCARIRNADGGKLEGLTIKAD